jgi:hypothetical protein
MREARDVFQVGGRPDSYGEMGGDLGATTPAKGELARAVRRRPWGLRKVEQRPSSSGGVGWPPG